MNRKGSDGVGMMGRKNAGVFLYEKNPERECVCVWRHGSFGGVEKGSWRVKVGLTNGLLRDRTANCCCVPVRLVFLSVGKI